MVDLARNIDIGIESRQATRGARLVNRALDSIKRRSRRLADSSQRDVARMRSGFAGLRTLLLSLGGALAGRSLIQSTKDFGQAVADLSAITGATGADLDFLAQRSREFGETTTLSASQAAEAFKLIASAKPDLLTNVEALAAVTREAIALSEATGNDLALSADTLGVVLNQFQLAASDASRVINVLAAGSKLGAADVGALAEALKNTGATAAVSGLSIEDTVAALEALAAGGIKGAEAGTGLNSILTRLAKQSRDEFNPEVVGIVNAFNNIAEAGLTAQERIELFGTFQRKTGETLLAQRSIMQGLARDLIGTTIAYEQQAIRTNTLQGDVLELKSAYEGLELTIGEAGVSDALRQLTQAATENIRAIARNPLTTRAVETTIRTTATAIADIKLLFSQLTDQIETTGGGAAVFEGIWEGAINNIVNWTKFLWEQFVVGGPANLKLGITLMIAAMDRFRIGVEEKWNLAVSAIKLGTELLVANIVGAFRLVGPNIQRVFQVVVNAIGRAFDNIKLTIFESVESIVGEIQQKLFNAARNLAAIGWDDSAEEIIGVARALGGVVSATDDVRESVAANERARQAELEAIDNTIELIKAARDGRIQAAKDAAIAEVNAYTETAEAARLASQVAVDGAIAERDATLAALQALREKRDLLQSFGGEDDEVPEVPEGGGGEGLGDPADDAADAYENLGETAKRVVDDMSEGIATMATEGKLNFKDMAESIIKDIIRIWIKSQLLNSLSSFFGGFGGGAASAAGGGGGAVQIGPPAQFGSNFTVGGSGGTDSQIVAFRATPGESVSVKTPEQQRMSGGQVVKFNQNLTIDARGADAARIEAQLPIWADRIKQQTLADVNRMKQQGYLRI